MFQSYGKPNFSLLGDSVYRRICRILLGPFYWAIAVPSVVVDVVGVVVDIDAQAACDSAGVRQ